MNQSDYWRKRGDYYLEEFGRHSEKTNAIFAEQERAFAEALDLLDKTKIATIFEIGCGFGRMTKILQAKFPDARILATDISRGQIDNAWRLNASTNTAYGVMDFTELDRNRQFDLVVACEVFLHFDQLNFGDPEYGVKRVLQKAQRISNYALIHVDPFLDRVETESNFSELFKPWKWLGETRTDWDHNYPHNYDHSMIKKLTMIPIINEKQHIFIVERK